MRAGDILKKRIVPLLEVSRAEHEAEPDGDGDLLPVSAFPVDGTWPVGTAKWEKRNLALEIPVWDDQG